MQLLSRLVKGMFNQPAKGGSQPTGATARPVDQPMVNRHIAWLKQTLHHNEQAWLKLYRAMDTAG